MHEWVDSQGGSLDEGREQQGGGGSHAHARQLPGGCVHGAVGQRPAGLALGLTEHLCPGSQSFRCSLIHRQNGLSKMRRDHHSFIV